MSGNSLPAPTRSARRDSQLDGQRLDQVGRVVGAQPADARVAAEPGPLPAGEPSGAPHGQLHRLVQRARAGEMVEQLLVAEGLAGGARHAASVVEQPSGLVDEPGGELPAVALLDAG